MALFRIYLFILMCWGVVGYFIAPSAFNKAFLFVNALLAFATLVFALALAVLKFPRFSWVSILGLFSLSYVVIHFMYALLVVFYDRVEGEMFIWMYPEVVCRASCASLSGFAGFLLGYFSWRLKRGIVASTKPVPTMHANDLKVWVYILGGVAMLFLAVVFAIDSSFYLSGAYGLAQGSAVAAGLQHVMILYKVFYFASVVLDLYRLRVSYSALNPFRFALSLNPFAVVNTVVMLGLSFYVGDRGPILQVLALYCGFYSIFYFRLRLPFVVLGLVLGAVGMGVIRDFRTTEQGVSLSQRIKEGESKMEDKVWYDIPGELGSNVRVLHVAIKTSDGYNYFWGLFKLNNVLSTVPFAARFASGPLGVYMRGLTSSSYLTAVIIGPYSKIGVGTTIVTDIFLDFGIFGCPTLMALLGMFFAWIENRCYSSLSIYAHTACMMCLAFAFYWPRSSYITSSKEIVWTIFLVFLLHMTIGKKLKLPSGSILR